MDGFDGPFVFVLDDTAERIEDSAAPFPVDRGLCRSDRGETSAVFRVRIGVKRSFKRTTKRHAWERVRRLWVDMTPACHGVRFLQAHPQTQRLATRTPNRGRRLSGSMSLALEVPLFSKFETTLKVDPVIPQYLHKDDFICVAHVTNRLAQWAFTPGWSPATEFDIALHVGFDGRRPAEHPALAVKLFPEIRNRGNGIIRWLPFVPHDAADHDADSPRIIPLRA